jgi:hypothetical protein
MDTVKQKTLPPITSIAKGHRSSSTSRGNRKVDLSDKETDVCCQEMKGSHQQTTTSTAALRTLSQIGARAVDQQIRIMITTERNSTIPWMMMKMTTKMKRDLHLTEPAMHKTNNTLYLQHRGLTEQYPRKGCTKVPWGVQPTKLH